MPLQVHMNWLALDGLPEPEEGWIAALAAAGYDGVQFIDPPPRHLLAQAREKGLAVCGSGRVNAVDDAGRLAEEAARDGLECLTLHVGWGHESDREGGALIEAILLAEARSGLPLFVETHRATIFQDSWRSVEWVRRFPDLRFNADWSHWYTGLEFVYGGFANKWAYVRPVAERVGFMHGRIGNPGCIQVDIGPLEQAGQRSFVQHFQTMWTDTFELFLRREGASASFPFAVELLGPEFYYARQLGGLEETDRWAQSLVLCDLARACFAAAERRLEEAALRSLS